MHYVTYVVSSRRLSKIAHSGQEHIMRKVSDEGKEREAPTHLTL